MVLQDNGTLYGWGYNGNGLIEEDTHTDSYAPKQIMTGVEACAISKWSNANAAVIKTDGSLWTWGLNEAGQIGDGTGKQAVNPVQIMDGIKSISIGNRFMAAIDTNGDLWTWGDNTFGQLGNGNTSSVNQPQKVMDEVESIELGPYMVD
jgi:alpha-tubulin suppressor-like RCC1 family protein